MISAAICGLGRWGQAIVTAVQGKSDRMRFVSGATGLMATVRAVVPFWRIHVFGSEARDEGNLRVGYIGAPDREHTFEPADSLRALVESFADAVEGARRFRSHRFN